MSGDALAAAAEALVGTRFRLHGRDPETGLDCVGVLAASLAAIGRPAPLPTGYGLRSRHLPGLAGLARACGLAAAEGPPRPGDVLLLRLGPCQHHLVVAVHGGRFVHAHASLRRVVAAPPPLPAPALRRWRLT
jgi:cell wall-associated NlpC family hydrolase